MSRYGDSEYANEKNDISYEIEAFLETHPVEELLRIIADILEWKR